MKRSRPAVNNRLVLRTRAAANRKTSLPFFKRHSLINDFHQILHSLGEARLRIPCENQSFPVIFTNQDTRFFKLVELALDRKQSDIEIR